jgi:hypothetical protein
VVPTDTWTLWITVMGLIMLFAVLIVMYLMAAFRKQQKIEEKRDITTPCARWPCGHDRIFHMWGDGLKDTAECSMCACDMFVQPAPMWNDWKPGKHRG